MAEGYTVAELLTRVSDLAGLTVGTSAHETRVYQALTAAGRTASTWRGEPWPWLTDGTGNFPMVSGTASYTLRTVNSNDMSDLNKVTRVYYDDDWALQPITWRQYRMAQATSLNDVNSKPTAYVVSDFEPVIYLLPEPNNTDTINVDYIKYHKKIAVAGDSNLIVPWDYQEGVYVAGAAWLLRRDAGDIASLNECPEFVEAMDRMQESLPMSYDEDQANQLNEPFGAGEGHLPHDQKVFHHGCGEYTIMGTVSI